MGSDRLYSTAVSEDIDPLIFDSWNIPFLFIAVVINKKSTKQSPLEYHGRTMVFF